MKIPVCGAAYAATSIDANNQQCVNMFPAPSGVMGRGSADETGKVMYHLLPTSGMQLLTNLGTTGTRGCFAFAGAVYVVYGASVYKLDVNTGTETATTTLLGTLSTSEGVVKAAANPTQIIFVDGSTSGRYYTFGTGVWSTISDLDYPGASQVVFLDGYFIINKPNSGQFYASALNNANDWDALDVATAESSTDNIVAMGVAKGELWLLGSDSTEIWYNAANATGMPLSNRTGLNINIGCGAANSLVQINDVLIWLDNRGFIVQSDVSPFIRNNNSGYQLKIVSTEAITAEILGYSRRDDAIAMTYNDRGHLMYQITFPTERKTWVYDFTTTLWHERSYFNDFYSMAEEHLGQFCCNIGTALVMSGQRDGKIYLSKSNVYTDNGNAIHRSRTTPILNDEFNRITLSRLYLRMETGNVPQGVSPKIMLRISHDAGHSWSNEMARDIGSVGQFASKITWNRLGALGREWVLQFKITDSVGFAIIDCSADIAGG